IPVDLDPSNECVRVVPMAFVRGSEPSVACGRRPPPAAGPAAPTAPAAPATPAPPTPDTPTSSPSASLGDSRAGGGLTPPPSLPAVPLSPSLTVDPRTTREQSP